MVEYANESIDKWEDALTNIAICFVENTCTACEEYARVKEWAGI